MFWFAWALVGWFQNVGAESRAEDLCRIEVVEQGTGWPVPMVELRTVSGLRFVSDNAGVIAFDLSECWGRDTWFSAHGQGYSLPADGFGFQGVKLIPAPGKTLRVEVRRDIIARRIGRLTGSGLLAESQRLGDASPVLESGIVGCDSVQATVFRDRLFWVWGDSNVPHYPLGIFHATAATSALGPLQRHQPPLSFALDYFRDEQRRPRGVATLPGRGPTWLTALVGLRDAQGDEHLVATYLKVEPPLAAWQRGLCEWNEAEARFEVKRVLWNRDAPAAGDQPGADGDQQPAPAGHAARWRDAEGRPWLLFGNPFPQLQMPDTYESWIDPSTWRRLQSPRKIAAAKPLAAASGDAAASLASSTESASVAPHSGSIAWNEYRRRWVAIWVESFGRPSALGEVWYCESESPLGPWGPAVKILSHRAYSFYNPLIHAEFSPADSSLLYFEGTYTTLFAGPERSKGIAPSYFEPTPRYEYNQILYQLDLKDVVARLADGGNAP